MMNGFQAGHTQYRWDQLQILKLISPYWTYMLLLQAIAWIMSYILFHTEIKDKSSTFLLYAITAPF